MSERDTREGVETDYKYMLFDIMADKVADGELTLEQAMVQYTMEMAWAEHDDKKDTTT